MWEAIMFAAHYGLSNLVAIADLNKQQALDYSALVFTLSPMADRCRAFGWDVCEVDGHNVAEITETIAGFETNSGPPHVLIANIIFDKSASDTENQIKWHYCLCRMTNSPKRNLR